MERHPEGTRLLIRLSQNLAGEEGFEPSLHDPESCVLPLDDSPVPLKIAAEIGQKIQSFLPNPPLSPESMAELILKDQPARRDPACLLLASSTRSRGYNEVTDNGNETTPPLAARQRKPSIAPLTRQSDHGPSNAAGIPYWRQHHAN